MALPKYPAWSQDPIMDAEDYLVLDRSSAGPRFEYLGGSTYHSMIIKE